MRLLEILSDIGCYGPEGRGFESLTAYHKKRPLKSFEIKGLAVFFVTCG